MDDLAWHRAGIPPRLTTWVFATALSLGVAGCADTTVKDFNRGDASDRQFNQDGAACELEGEKSRTTGGAGGLIGAASYYDSYSRVFDACMRSKGYARKNQ